MVNDSSVNGAAAVISGLNSFKSSLSPADFKRHKNRTAKEKFNAEIEVLDVWKI